MTAVELPYKTLDGHQATIPQSMLRWNNKIEGEGHCRMCLRHKSVRQLTRHHLIPQSWWRNQTHGWRQLRNLSANVVPLCRPCHDLVEKERDSRCMLRRMLTQTEIAFIISVRSQKWLDMRYPL